MAPNFKTICIFLLLINFQFICCEKKILAVYWGQNSVSHGGQTEPSLEYFCSKQRYDIIILSFLNDFISYGGNGLPGLNFANHCSASISEHPGLLSCSHIVSAIPLCQSNGVKVLLALGGAKGNYGFNQPGKPTPEGFAKTIWDLFFNSVEQEEQRPFRDNVLDGIDLDIEDNNHIGYAEFVVALRSYMDSDTSKNYLITGAPQCPFPDRSLGPDGPGFEGTALQTVPHLFDYLFIQYYNNYCHPGNPDYFISNFNQWSRLATTANEGNGESQLKIVVGLPGGPGATINQIYFRTIGEVESIYEQLHNDVNFGGFMLWDAGWENSQITNGETYGEHLGRILASDKETIPITRSPVTTEQLLTTDSPMTTNAPVTIKPPTTDTPVKPRNLEDYCHEMRQTDPKSFLFPHPWLCDKFMICFHGNAFQMTCPSGTHWNRQLWVCDWPNKASCPYY